MKGFMIDVNICDQYPFHKHKFKQKRIIVPYKNGTLVYAIVRERVMVWFEEIDFSSYSAHYGAEVLYEVEISKDIIKKLITFVELEKEHEKLSKELYALEGNLITAQLLKG